jgi:hypothetical protein
MNQIYSQKTMLHAQDVRKSYGRKGINRFFLPAL